MATEQPQRGPALLVLALLLGGLGGACRKQEPAPETPEQRPQLDTSEEVDAPGICTAGCQRLERCVPELAGDLDGDPSVVAERLARECAPACEQFADQRSGLALRDCLELDSCTAFWGCVGTAEARSWLATVAPVGERTCENLCSQASACAIAKVCEAEAESGGRRGRGAKADKAESDKPRVGAEPGVEPGAQKLTVDPQCMRDELTRDELEEHCLLQCRALPEDSQARNELIGCIDHVSCDGLLVCLDGWAETDYDDASGPTPGISPTCDSFCTRAIVCGAAEEQVELEPEELEQLKQTMTSTYVECAVQCEKDLEAGGEAVREAFDQCTAVETCEDFTTCADEV